MMHLGLMVEKVLLPFIRHSSGEIKKKYGNPHAEQ
jgi:hypothetical protein